nr:hypothetical protein [Streptomyces noursei]
MDRRRIFAAYGLDDIAIIALRAWAVKWAEDLATRLLEEADHPNFDGSFADETTSANDRSESPR